LAEAAVLARISYFQIREKHLTAGQLFELTRRAAAVTENSETRLLVNDRIDVALAAGADGVHLTETSIPVDQVRRALGRRLLLGVSTHTLDGVRAARDGGADFMVFGPVFPTPSKPEADTGAGLTSMRDAVDAAGSIPVLALGGVNLENFGTCLAAGAAGLAGIRLFSDPDRLNDICAIIRSSL
jgi:thiamine-phosphate pyrophosphorylase